jgi:ribosome maturation factor RimP
VSRSADHSRLEAFVRPIVEQLGCDLEAVEVSPAGRRRLLRVLVDRDGGISLDDVAEVTRVVSKALDADDVMGEGAYTLEISSPGVDRPLTLPRHWRRNTGRLVTVTLVAGGKLRGRIVTATDERVELEAGGKTSTIGYDEVAKAKVEVEFNRKPDSADGG